MARVEWKMTFPGFYDEASKGNLNQRWGSAPSPLPREPLAALAPGEARSGSAIPQRGAAGCSCCCRGTNSSSFTKTRQLGRFRSCAGAVLGRAVRQSRILGWFGAAWCSLAALAEALKAQPHPRSREVFWFMKLSQSCLGDRLSSGFCSERGLKTNGAAVETAGMAFEICWNEFTWIALGCCFTRKKKKSPRQGGLVIGGENHGYLLSH